VMYATLPAIVKLHLSIHLCFVNLIYKKFKNQLPLTT
jgi:hypothetical protein